METQVKPMDLELVDKTVKNIEHLIELKFREINLYREMKFLLQVKAQLSLHGVSETEVGHFGTKGMYKSVPTPLDANTVVEATLKDGRLIKFNPPILRDYERKK